MASGLLARRDMCEQRAVQQWSSSQPLHPHQPYLRLFHLDSACMRAARRMLASFSDACLRAIFPAACCAQYHPNGSNNTTTTHTHQPHPKANSAP